MARHKQQLAHSYFHLKQTALKTISYIKLNLGMHPALSTNTF